MEYNFKDIPFNDIVRIGQRTMLYRDLFTISWLLGRFCNYNCSYCWPYARSSIKDHRPTELCLKTIDEIKRQARDNGFNSFHFSLSGGEPTFHPGYLDILQYLANDVVNTNYTSVHMTTNLSRKMKWFETYVDYVSHFHRASITASYHRESINTIDKQKEFADKLEFCQEYDVQVTVNCVMVPDKFEEIWDEVMMFHERGINVTLKPQSNENASKIVDGYTDSQLERLYNGLPQKDYTSIKNKYVTRPKSKFKLPDPDVDVFFKNSKNVPWNFQVELTDSSGKQWYMDQAERFNAFNFNNFNGWECSSGYRSIIIREPDGNIKRSYSCHDEPLGNIETGFKLFDKPKLCITNSCVSSADSKIPKRKSNFNNFPLNP